MTQKTIKYIAVAVVVIVIGLLIYGYGQLKEGGRAAKLSFADAKEEAADAAYQFFYNSSYASAESKHHVSNEVSITITNLTEKQRLEVLKVSDISYQVEQSSESKNLFGTVTRGIKDFFAGDVDSWLEVPGSGVFAINLEAGESIIDDARRYVLIRVPEPELVEFTIDYDNVELLQFSEGGVLNNSAKVGVDKAMEQLKDAELTMRQEIYDNQEFYRRARESAVKMLTNLVRQLNQELPDLTVEVEFIG